MTEEDFRNKILEIEKGDIDSLYGVAAIQRRYVSNMRLSQFRFYLRRFADLLIGCSLDEIRFFLGYKTGLLEASAFTSEITTILEVLDRDKIAADFTQLPPRHWSKLLSLSILENFAQTGIIRDIIDRIDIDALKANLEKYAGQHAYELRVFIYQLNYGSDYKRQLFAEVLAPYVKEIVASSKENDVQEVLVAYTRLDQSRGNEIAAELGKPAVMPPYEKSDNDVSFQEIRESIALADSEGRDEILFETLFKIQSHEEDSPLST